MAGSVNKCILVGRVGRDPEVRTFNNGGRVVSFSMATSETWRDKTTGERKERTEWHNVSVLNENLGKVAEQYLRKGDNVYVEGQIQSREYTDKDGNQRKATEIVLPRFGGALTLLNPPGDRNSQSSSQRDAAPRQPARGNVIDDEIPFAPEWR